MTLARASLILMAALAVRKAAMAGPPFVTDDPEPAPYQHWEINNAVLGTVAQGSVTAGLPQIDANYGALPDLQLHIQPQLVAIKTEAVTHFGVGDTEIGAKYRFIEEDDDGWVPMVSLYPLYEIPTGDRRRGLSAGVGRTFVPIWAQKTIGKWQVFGGAGYWIDPGAGGKNGWFTGAVVLYQFTDALQLGGEAFYQTALVPGGQDTAGFNLGGSYRIAEGYALLFSAGRGLDNAAATNQFSTYLALQVTF